MAPCTEGDSRAKVILADWIIDKPLNDYRSAGIDVDGFNKALVLVAGTSYGITKRP